MVCAALAATDELDPLEPQAAVPAARASAATPNAPVRHLGIRRTCILSPSNYSEL
jgi:hypothetical protein